MRIKTIKEVYDLIDGYLRTKNFVSDGDMQTRFVEIWQRLKKLEALTKADDYEYVTETKLVKKNKENGAISCCPKCDDKGIISPLIAKKSGQGYIGYCPKCDYFYNPKKSKKEK